MSNTLTIWQSIIIGGAGGAVAGLTIYLTKSLVEFCKNKIDSNQILKFLAENSSHMATERWVQIKRIASYTNLQEDRVRYLCSEHKKIQMYPGGKEDTCTVFTFDQHSGNSKGNLVKAKK